MKISRVNQRHIYGSPLELLSGIQTAETRAQNHHTVPLGHGQPFPSGNLFAGSFILRIVGLSSLIRGKRVSALGICLLMALIVSPLAALRASDDRPASGISGDSASISAPPAPVIVIGFLGGFVRHDDGVHIEVSMAQRLQTDYAGDVRVATFENRRRDDAHKLILRLLAAGRDTNPTLAQKRAARIILYGHSWGASAVVDLARALDRDGIPVLLTVQVDSVAKIGQNDADIPDNVAHAANFYQTKGFVHGQSRIRAVDPARTDILGNFLFDYSAKPISCPKFPWYDRVFMRSHIEIECDPNVWQKVGSLIREQLPASPQTARSDSPAATAQN